MLLQLGLQGTKTTQSLASGTMQHSLLRLLASAPTQPAGFEQSPKHLATSRIIENRLHEPLPRENPGRRRIAAPGDGMPTKSGAGIKGGKQGRSKKFQKTADEIVSKQHPGAEVSASQTMLFT